MVKLYEVILITPLDPVGFIDATATDGFLLEKLERLSRRLGNVSGKRVPHERSTVDLLADVFQQRRAAVLEQVEHGLESLRPTVIGIRHFLSG